jgi:hypothetical protein
MNNLFSSILENIKKNYKQKADSVDDVACCIEKIIGIQIPLQSIKIVGTTLYIYVSPTIKSAIVAKKERIFLELAVFNIDTIR